MADRRLTFAEHNAMDVKAIDSLANRHDQGVVGDAVLSIAGRQQG